MGKDKITTEQMELLVYNYFEKSSIVIVPKFTKNNAVKYEDETRPLGYKSENIVSHECDILSVTKNNYLREVEIKISVSDFKADFKKKHNHEGNIRQFYYAVPYYILDDIKNLVPEHAGILVAERNEAPHELWQLKKHKKTNDNKSASPIDEKMLNEIFRIGYLKYWFYRKRHEE